MLCDMTEVQSTDQRRTPTDDEMPGLLAELESSGGNISAFAKERGLAPWKLYRAKRGGKARRSKASAAELVPVRVVGPAARRTAPLELVLSSGHRLVVPPDFDEAALRRLMGVLASC